MSFLLPSRFLRVTVWAGLGAAAALAAPAACLYPDYTFDEPEPTGTTSSGGGGGAGGMTTTSSGGGSPTSTSTGGMTEDCTNGVDDNGDGKVDCEDPECGAFSCVPEVPEGWTGYVALFNGAPALDPGCPVSFPSTSTPSYVGNSGLTALAASCECTCGVPQGAACAALSTIALSTGDAPCGQTTYCSGQLTVPNPWVAGTCENSNYYSGGQLTCGPNTGPMCNVATGDPCNVSVTASALTASGGSCTPNPVVTTLPDVQWSTFARACGDAGQSGKGCNIGQTCLPRPPVAYESGVCISHAGDVSCPPGAFNEKHVYFDSVTDTRACTGTCACGAPSGVTCPTTISIYSDAQVNTCNTLIASFPAGSCANVVGNPNIAGRRASAPGGPTGGSCIGSGGVATGTATAANPTTFCCVP